MSRRWGFRDYDYFPPPSRPREVKGGIKAQSKRGTFGESWWAKRWITVLESFDMVRAWVGADLTLVVGRSYRSISIKVLSKRKYRGRTNSI